MTLSQHPYMSINDCTLPTQVLAILADVVSENSGVKEHEILEGSGLRPRDLRLSTSMVKYHQVLTIIDNALKLCPISGLGFEVAKRENPSTWGLLGFAMMSSNNLQGALSVAKRFLATGPALIDMEFKSEPGKCTFQANTFYAANHLLPFLMEELSMSITTVFSIMLNRPFRFNEVKLSYNRPNYGHLYEQYLGCPATFSSNVNQLSFDSSLLDCPLTVSDPVSASLAERLCADAIKNQLQKGGICSDIKRILSREAGVYPTMELVAQELKMSQRTLRRQLSELETSFQAIYNEVRMSVAIKYLKNSQLPLEDISALVGFNDYNNFRKAFKRWTHNPPSYYRN